MEETINHASNCCAQVHLLIDKAIACIRDGASGEAIRTLLQAKSYNTKVGEDLDLISDGVNE